MKAQMDKAIDSLGPQVFEDFDKNRIVVKNLKKQDTIKKSASTLELTSPKLSKV